MLAVRAAVALLAWAAVMPTRAQVSVMPPFRKTEISDADLAALAAYLAPRAH